jgi:VIT1/CCC1 family predicted Fe2+/Mn2+ transporter
MNPEPHSAEMHKRRSQPTPTDQDSVDVAARAASSAHSSSVRCTPEGPTSGLEPHRLGGWLRDIILGGQDGLVNVLGIVLGATAAGADTRILIAAALAATFAESLSMGAVAYTSRLAERDHYVSELQRERSEIRECPEEERQEVREIYRGKGFDGPLLDAIVDRITANEETWLNVMMAEELRLEPVDPRDVLRTAVIVTLASFVGSLVPLLPFLIVPSPPAAWLSVAISAATLFGVGAYKAASLVGDWRRSGAQMVLIGLGAALAGFAVGRVFGVSE